LWQAATVPLILAFYCIIGGSSPLPEFRHDLYARVLKRMLTGLWRGSGNSRLDADACLQELRAWAWSGAVNHPISGVGTWPDDIPIGPHRLGEAEDSALDNIATPLGPPDVDSGKIMRHFIHRSIREHLVAEQVAGLPVDQAVEALLPHIWYDPDWVYSAPVALAMHPDHDQLLRDLICRAALLDHVPGELSVIDAGWEFRRFLARVADESDEADWSSEVATMISYARVELARSGRVDGLGGAARWSTSNHQARDALLGLLLDQTTSNPGDAPMWAAVLTQLDPAAGHKRQARGALLALLASQTSGMMPEMLATAVTMLDPTAEDKRRVLDALLASDNSLMVGWLAATVARLDPTEEDKRRVFDSLLGLLASEPGHWAAERLASAVAQLYPTIEDKRRVREVLLALLANQIGGGEAERLPAAVSRADGSTAAVLAAGLAQLDPTTEDKRQARQVLLALLADRADSRAVEGLAAGLAQLDPTAEDKRRVREVLLALLADRADVWNAERLAAALTQWDPTAEDKCQARQVLLALLASQPGYWDAERLAAGLTRLDPTTGDKRQARQVLLGLMPDWTDAKTAALLAGWLIQLDPTAEDKRHARGALLELLTEARGREVTHLLDKMIQLDPTPMDTHQAFDALLEFLVVQADRRKIDKRKASELVGGVVRLATTAEYRLRARDALLGLLARETDGQVAAQLMGGVVQLDPTTSDLSSWHSWPIPPTDSLLAAVRQNSALPAWLAALPQLASLSG
jgi:hypothetical protein